MTLAELDHHEVEAAAPPPSTGKVTMPATALAGLLRTALGAAPDKAHTLPILNCARLVADGVGTVTVECTNLDIAVRAGIPAQVDAEGTIVMPARKLAGVLAGFDGDVTITAENGVATVACGRSRFKLQTLPPAEFPDLNGASQWVDHQGNTVTVDRLSLDGADIGRLATVAGAIGKEETRYYLQGVFVHAVDGLLTFVATDGHKLLRVKTSVPYAGRGAIVHGKTVALIARLFKDGAQVAFDGRVIEVTSGATWLVAKLIDGSYPDYERVLPAAPEHAAVAPRAEIVATLARFVAMIDTDKGLARTAILSWDAEARSGELHLSAVGDGAEGEAVIVAETSGAGRVGAGIELASVILGAVGGDDIRFAHGGGGDPILITAPTVPETTAILMPRRG